MVESINVSGVIECKVPLYDADFDDTDSINDASFDTSSEQKELIDKVKRIRMKAWQNEIYTYLYYDKQITIDFNLLDSHDVEQRQAMVYEFLKKVNEPKFDQNREPLKNLVKLMIDNLITSSLLKNQFYYIGHAGQEESTLNEAMNTLQRCVLRN